MELTVEETPPIVDFRKESTKVPKPEDRKGKRES